MKQFQKRQETESEGLHIVSNVSFKGGITQFLCMVFTAS